MAKSIDTLKLEIDFNQTIRGIQKQFNDLFPYLTLEFFRYAPDVIPPALKNKLILYDVRLINLQKVTKEGVINFSVNTTVLELEEIFNKEFGLYVQVFRKSGKIWLETTETDSWTLFQQNEEGKSIDENLRGSF